MRDFYETNLKDEYTSWVEAITYLHVEGISRKKFGQLFNIVEKYQPIHSDYWDEYGFCYKKINAVFKRTSTQSFLKRITCNL